MKFSLILCLLLFNCSVFSQQIIDDYELANLEFAEALQLYKGITDVEGLIQTYIKLGYISELKNDSGKAIEYYTKAMNLNKGTSSSKLSLSLLDRIGALHTKTGQVQKAIEYFNEGISRSDHAGHADVHISLLTNAGKAYSQIGNKKAALVYHNRAIEKARQYNKPELEAQGLVNIADLLKEENADKSLEHLKNALLIADSLHNQKLSAKIYLAMGEVYRQQENFEEALLALEAHHRLLDSLFSKNKANQIASLRAGYELEKAKLHVEQLQLANQRRTFELNISIITVMAVLLILLIVWYYFRKTRTLNKQLQESNHIKDKLFSIIGHDLRGPVGGMVQMIEIMETGAFDNQKRQQILAELKKQGQVTFETLTSLLTWGNTQLQGAHINPINFNPQSIIAKNIATLKTQAANKSISINDYSKEKLTAYGDPDHFDFIIRNLLSNAIKFSHPSGNIQINEILNPGNGYITFSVKDNGTGISKEKQQQFLTSGMSTSYGTKGEKGTGLGLLLSKEFVQANGGELWLESKEGEGTIFYFTFKKGES